MLYRKLPSAAFSLEFRVNHWLLMGLSLLLTGLCAYPALAQTRFTTTAFLRCTRDEPILKAMLLMQDGASEGSLTRIVNKPMRVIFKDMKTLNKALQNYDALSWISSANEQVIFVNAKHHNAPPEAIAALIAHEALHDDPYNSLNEEVQSWEHEARVWAEMKAHNPSLAQIPPGQIALVDRENRILEEYRQGRLPQFVRSSPGYQGLLDVSPGFEKHAP